MKISQNTFLTLAYFLKNTFRSSLSYFKALDIDFTAIFRLSFPLLITAATVFCFTKFQTQRNIKRYSLPPGPTPWPIIGCLPQMIKNKPTFRWIHNLMNQMNTDIACIRLGSVHVIPVTCPKLAREFLKTQDANFASRPITMSTSTTSKGHLATIFAPMGGQWKKMRKLMRIEVLSPAKHRWLYSKRHEEADHLLRYVYNQCDDFEKGGIVDVRKVAQHYCGNVIRKLVFNKRFFGDGMSDGGPGYEEEEHISAVFQILEYTYSFCVSDYMPCTMGHDLDGHEKKVKEANEKVEKYHNPIIEERYAEWRKGNKREVEDLLDVLITFTDIDGNFLTVKEIKAQITEIMLATVDNPSNAFEWALAEMINQPHIFKNAIEELDKIVGKERLVEESDCAQLNYIKACVRETFRLHPVVPFNVPHVSVIDTVVSNYFIPSGSHVLLSRYGLGRNPMVWDEPLKFKPERHLENGCSNVVLTESELRFISFSTGIRGCVGVTLGSTMTVMLFARLLQGFTWELPLDVSTIDLSESENNLQLAKPLFALAKPRLPTHLYVNKE